MTPAEFAKANAIKRYRIPAGEVPYKIAQNPNYEGYRFYAHVVGFMNHAVVIEFDDAEVREQCWPLHEGVTLTTHKDYLYDRFDTKVWAVDHKMIKIAADQRAGAQWSPSKKKKPLSVKREREAAKPPKVYNTKCELCHSPARRGGGIVMCSNDSCDSRRGVMKNLKIKRQKTTYIRCPLMVNSFHRTPEGGVSAKQVLCNARATYVEKRSSYDRNYVCNCEHGHSFIIEPDQIKKGSVILMTISGHDHNDRIWTGSKWEKY